MSNIVYINPVFKMMDVMDLRISSETLNSDAIAFRIEPTVFDATFLVSV